MKKEIEKLVLHSTRHDIAGGMDFAKSLNKYFAEGYKILVVDTRDEIPTFVPGRTRVVMVRELEVKDEESKPTQKTVSAQEDNFEENMKKSGLVDFRLTELEELRPTKENLLKFADEHDLDIPEKMKQPSQIAKHLKETLSKPKNDE